MLITDINADGVQATAEEILAVDGVDGCWIGPTDLARSIGVDLNTPVGWLAHEAAILRVLADWTTSDVRLVSNER